MENKIDGKNLIIINNEFFDRIENVDFLVDSLVQSINNKNLNFAVDDLKFIYVNNGNTTWDAKYNDNGIFVVNSLSDITFSEYTSVMYSNIPFFSIANVIKDVLLSDKYPKNTILTQEGYNLLPKFQNNSDNRYIYCKSKINSPCNVSGISFFIFFPNEETEKFSDGVDLVRYLHKNHPIVIPEFVNTYKVISFNLISSEDEYIKYCLPSTDVGTVGTYAIYFPDFENPEFASSTVSELLKENPEIKLDIRTPMDISGIFDEEIKEVDGELSVVSNFDGDVSRINIANKDLLHYDYNIVHNVIDFSDFHFVGKLSGYKFKYMKAYNDSYIPLYNITNDDIMKAKKVAVKRTMGMGDALLTLPILAYLKKTNPNLELHFYSMYDFTPYMADKSIISEFHKIDSNSIFTDITPFSFDNFDTLYDIVLDFDLAYENQTMGGSFFEYYMSFFADGALESEIEQPILSAEMEDQKYKHCVLVAEGSGWGGKEPSIDLFELLGKTMKDKGFKIDEPGINRITTQADNINSNSDFDVLFNMVRDSVCYIGTDSGVSHIANLMGKPSFIIGGAADPVKTQYDVSLVYPYGKTDLLCYGCRHNFKGFRAMADGSNTFVPHCYNKKQFECTRTLDIEMAVEELNNFLEQYEL